jgi:hypothetical protein
MIYWRWYPANSTCISHLEELTAILYPLAIEGWGHLLDLNSYPEDQS